jgi:hypothetical protein
VVGVWVFVALFLCADLALLFVAVKAELNGYLRRRTARVEQELIQAQQRLTELGRRHATDLDQAAFEARKALIVESFRASQKTRRTTP